MKFNETNISDDILKSLAEMGFEEMTPIQEAAIPVMLSGRDVIGQAQTGTGKTAAFGIPMINLMDPEEECVQGLVLCPTRELAVQASLEISKMSRFVKGVRVTPVYGGQDISRQINALKGNISIVVGTPGRVMDHMRRRTLKFDGLKMLVLDEADEMLDMGFREDIETICKSIPDERQTALFSATMPDEIVAISKKYQKHAEQITVVTGEELTTNLVKQLYYVVKGREKDTSLCRLLDYLSPKRALIFCNTKRKVDELTLVLKGKGYSAEALHGDLSQHQRDRVMNLFRNGNLELLLATDVAARGLDVDDVDMVFNYDMPQDMEYYVHRIGRTGRAGKTGRAISIISGREQYKIDSLEEYTGAEIQRKEMPTANDALTVKAYKNLSDAIEYCEGMDITQFMKIVYKRCDDDDLDPLQVAAAFLRMSMGNIEAEPKDDDQKGGRRGDREKPERRNKSYRSSKDSDKARSGGRSGGRRPAGRRDSGWTTEGEGRRGGRSRKPELPDGIGDSLNKRKKSGGSKETKKGSPSYEKHDKYAKMKKEKRQW